MSAEWVATISGIAGTALGGSIAVVSSLWTASRSASYAREAATRDRKRDAYLEIFGWFSLSRDELRRTIDDKRPWNPDYSDAREQARMDALTETYGGPEFREAVASWPDAFNTARLGYERYRVLTGANATVRVADLSVPRLDPKSEQAAVLRGQIEKDLRHVRSVLANIAEQIRKEIQ
jgi:hypothetical protein